MPTTVAAKNTMLDALTINTLKLHSGDPTGDGTQNQIAGASKAVTYSAASAGSRDLSATASFTGLAASTTVSYFSLWNGATFIASKAFPNGGETFTNAGGTANITSAAITVTDV